MGRIIVSFFVGLTAGLAFMVLQPAATLPTPGSLGPAGHVAAVECVCDMHSSAEIDTALQVERETNNLLIAEIDQLQSEIEGMAADLVEMEFRDSDDWMQNAARDLMADETAVDRRQQLVEGGFDPIRAEWLLQREQQLQIEATRSGTDKAGEFKPMTALEARYDARAALRKEIGDYEYERYLAASGQSTMVIVTQVMTDSPAQNAGLQVGDRILHYGGERVFNMIELAERAQSRDQGTVILNIERNGSPMQLAVSQGPLGISGGKPIPF